MDETLGVGVLNGVAALREELKPAPCADLLPVAVAGDGLAFDVLHHEVGTAVAGHARIEDLGDVGMIHHRQRLTLLLEACEDGTGVHARLENLDRDALHHRLAALGEPDDAEPALSQRLQQAIGPDAIAGFFKVVALGRDGPGIGAVGFRHWIQRRGGKRRVVSKAWHDGLFPVPRAAAP